MWVEKDCNHLARAISGIIHKPIGDVIFRAIKCYAEYLKLSPEMLQVVQQEAQSTIASEAPKLVVEKTGPQRMGGLGAEIKLPERVAFGKPDA